MLLLARRFPDTAVAEDIYHYMAAVQINGCPLLSKSARVEHDVTEQLSALAHIVGSLERGTPFYGLQIPFKCVALCRDTEDLMLYNWKRDLKPL